MLKIKIDKIIKIYFKVFFSSFFIVFFMNGISMLKVYYDSWHYCSLNFGRKGAGLFISTEGFQKSVVILMLSIFSGINLLFILVKKTISKILVISFYIFGVCVLCYYTFDLIYVLILSLLCWTLAFMPIIYYLKNVLKKIS